jgi:isopropylmalate/homocitrate/citramalate synthase
MNEPWKTDQWFTSFLNFEPEARSDLHFAPKVQFHDVSLRDGEQQTGVVFSAEDKIRIAEKLDEVGIHRIEAGMPAVSPDDEKAVRAIARLGLEAKVFAFSRCIVDEVKRIADMGVAGVVIEIPTSEHLLKHAYRWPIEKAIELSVSATRTAHENGLYTVFFTIDGTRTDFEWYLRLVETVAREGHMDSLAVVDTFGSLMPSAVPSYVRRLKSRIKVPLEIHFHDDYGCGTANTLLALANGAEVAHTTVTSIGERAGNVGYEELTLALLTCYGVDTGLKHAKMSELSRLVRKIAEISIPTNRPIVGDLLFQIESGIIATWFLNCGDEHVLECFPYHWRLVGQRDAGVVLGKNSGLDSVRHWLKKIGREVSEDQLPQLLTDVKRRSYELRGLLTEEDFERLAENYVKTKQATLKGAD